ncbi:MAG: hypothetical protein WC718_00165 [Phycisphaerales bacterium]|jgi:hypothetical protein
MILSALDRLGGFATGYEVAAFSPASLNPIAWWDASDASTLYDATTGGNLVTADGAYVARWEDKTANARHLLQSTESKRPTLQTAEQNSRSVLRWGGYALGTVLSVASFPSLTDLHVVAVAKVASHVTYGRILDRARATGFWLAEAPTSGQFIGAARETVAPLGAIVSGSVGAWFILDLWRIGADYSVSYNNGTPVADSSDTTATASGTMYVGDMAATATNAWNGDMAEILIFDNDLSSGDRAALLTHLATKWGITIA